MLHHGAVRDGTDELLARISLGPALNDALAHLSESFRAVVVLVDSEGHSYEDAAAVLHVPVGTVRSRLFRGRRLLQEALFAHARDAGFTCAMPAARPPPAFAPRPPPMPTEVPHV
jgi:RNA polymerase sigma-70 factor (ECF subfamily)